MIDSIAAVVTAIGVVFAGVQLRTGQMQRHRQFESLFIQRYWTLLDRLSPAARGDSVTYDDLDPSDRLTLELYVRLCEDQLEMREAGAITSWTYEQWRSGILATAEQPAFRSAVEVVSGAQASKCVKLRTLLTPDESYDPLTFGPFKKWIRGLR